MDHRGWVLLLMITGLSGCDYTPYPDKREDPVSTAQGFIAAARRGDCHRTWTYFSAETQNKIKEQSKRMMRNSPYYSEVAEPHRIHCLPYESYRPSSVRLASKDDRSAIVKVKERVPDPHSFSLPGWTPIGRMDEERTLNLARETDGWKIVPNVPEDPRASYGEKTYDIGRAVIVTRPSNPRQDGDTSFSVEGMMTMDVSPADLERALADPQQWPGFWPQVTSARWVGPKDTHGYRQLSVAFTLPDGVWKARVFFHQAGHAAEHSSFSFGFGPEDLYAPSRGGRIGGRGLLRWAATFSALPENRPQGGSMVRWSQSISHEPLARPELVGQQLEAFAREAKRRSGK